MGKETLYNKKSKPELKKIINEEKFNRQTISFYKYLRLNNLNQLRDKIYKSWDSLNILGRVYIAKEGINAQISIPDNNLNFFKNQLESQFNFGNLTFKVFGRGQGRFWGIFFKFVHTIPRDLLKRIR